MPVPASLALSSSPMSAPSPAPAPVCLWFQEHLVARQYRGSAQKKFAHIQRLAQGKKIKEAERGEQVNSNTDRHPSKSCLGGGDSAEGPEETVLFLTPKED
ncbi:hypothetical protein GJAV_G00072130, partial [Gymnothorax javanicus]